MLGKYKKLHQNLETERAGYPWTLKEDADLMKFVENRVSIDEIAKNHKRTKTAIKARIIKNAIEIMKHQNISIEEISEKVSIPIEEIKNELNNFSRKSSNKTDDNLTQILNVLSEMNNTFKMMLYFNFLEKFCNNDAFKYIIMIHLFIKNKI